jgi:hypothetical protein
MFSEPVPEPFPESPPEWLAGPPAEPLAEPLPPGCLEKNARRARTNLQATGENTRVGDRDVVTVAMRQHGNITRAQLKSAGITDKGISIRLANGRLHRIHAGIYAVGRPAVTPLERASAAVLAAGEHAALSHGSAMALWRLWRQWPAELEVTVSRGRPSQATSRFTVRRR